ncbi:hypothetical protein [Anaerorhabdus furcosa]|uniref:Uncharacterized protein n=1 Tax=Anaerorhabdus furcosa TaxID=118967 RepID=A0A1T4QE41_9FIRM|nr:hypothetical protein [Anaerorhabdus furcosa]SKA01964.1 hypothetical protein SAMN02745191_2432 [Anaerorhabdus furcosa]
MNNILELYKTYINPFVIGIFVVMIIITLFYAMRLLLNLKHLLNHVEEVQDDVIDINQQLLLAQTKKTVISSYYKKKKAQLNFLVSCLFFLHILNHKD